MPEPIPDNGSLRPHVLPSDEWPAPTRLGRRTSVSQFAFGIVVGMAASLIATAWAVRTHHWPVEASMSQASAAPPPVCSPPPAPAPEPRALAADLTACPAPAQPQGSSLANLDAASNTHTSAGEKLHKAKKWKARSKVPPSRGADVGSADGATAAIEREAASELGGASEPHTAAHSAARSAPAPAEPTAHVEDQAAAELSTSLK